MRSRILVALVGVVATVALIAALNPDMAGAQTTTSSSTTTTTIDPKVVAAKAADELSLPNASIATNPPAGQAQFTGLPTWLWVTPWAPVRHTASSGGTTVEVVAFPSSVRFDTGDGESVTCIGAGMRYDPSRPASAQSSDCTHTWRRSSAGASGDVFHVTATVTWSIRWFGGSLGDRQTRAGSVDLRVAESQGLDRPPETVPGQTVVGGSGATDGPGKGWNGKAPKPKDDGCDWWDAICGLKSAASTVGHCFFGGDHTCLKVGATIVTGIAAATVVGLVCATGVGCVILAAGAAGLAAGAVGGVLFCPGGESIASCAGRGALVGGLGGLALGAALALGAPLVVAGAAGGFIATLVDQIASGHFDPKALAVNTAAGAALAWLIGPLVGRIGGGPIPEPVEPVPAPIEPPVPPEPVPPEPPPPEPPPPEPPPPQSVPPPDVAAQSVDEVLAELRSGRTPPNLEVDTPDELRQVFERLTQGASPIQSSYPGELMELADGTRVGLRTVSRSGGPTIDVFKPDGTYVKVHLP